MAGGATAGEAAGARRAPGAQRCAGARRPLQHEHQTRTAVHRTATRSRRVQVDLLRLLMRRAAGADGHGCRGSRLALICWRAGGGRVSRARAKAQQGGSRARGEGRADSRRQREEGHERVVVQDS